MGPLPLLVFLHHWDSHTKRLMANGVLRVHLLGRVVKHGGGFLTFFICGTASFFLYFLKKGRC